VAWVAGSAGIRLAGLDGFWDLCIDRAVQAVGEQLGRAVLSPIGRVPFRQNLDFVGREAELETLRLHLSDHGQAYVYMGLLAIGQNAAASLQYVHQQKDQYALIMWINAGAASLRMEFLGMAGMLGVSLASGDDAESQRVGAEGNLEERNVEAVRSALEGLDISCLLVLDNVEEGSGLRKMLPRAGASCHVLASTQRRAEVEGVLGNRVEIAVRALAEDKALEVLTAGIELSPKETIIAESLAKRLDYLTLALAVLAQMMRDYGTLPSELLAALDKPTEGIKLFAAQPPLNEPDKSPDLIKLFDLTLKSVMGRPEGKTKKDLAGALLSVAGWMANAPIPPELLTAGAGHLERPFCRWRLPMGLGCS
jgi:hypothetical protein